MGVSQGTSREGANANNIQCAKDFDGGFADVAGNHRFGVDIICGGASTMGKDDGKDG